MTSLTCNFLHNLRIHKYSPDEAKELKQRKLIPNTDISSLLESNDTITTEESNTNESNNVVNTKTQIEFSDL
jgi:hypothetical protein